MGTQSGRIQSLEPGKSPGLSSQPQREGPAVPARGQSDLAPSGAPPSTHHVPLGNRQSFLVCGGGAGENGFPRPFSSPLVIPSSCSPTSAPLLSFISTRKAPAHIPFWGNLPCFPTLPNTSSSRKPSRGILQTESHLSPVCYLTPICGSSFLFLVLPLLFSPAFLGSNVSPSRWGEGKNQQC